MFQVAVRESVTHRTTAKRVVCVDSLPEAEIMGLKVADRMFQGKSLMLVHKGDLVYDIYETGEPIGQVLITTA